MTTKADQTVFQHPDLPLTAEETGKSNHDLLWKGRKAGYLDRHSHPAHALGNPWFEPPRERGGKAHWQWAIHLDDGEGKAIEGHGHNDTLEEALTALKDWCPKGAADSLQAG